MAAYMSTSLAIAILGAGSSYMPTLLSQLGRLRTQTPLTLKLYDRVETAQAAATRLADALLPSLPCTAHEDLSGSLDGRLWSSTCIAPCLRTTASARS